MMTRYHNFHHQFDSLPIIRLFSQWHPLMMNSKLWFLTWNVRNFLSLYIKLIRWRIKLSILDFFCSERIRLQGRIWRCETKNPDMNPLVKICSNAALRVQTKGDKLNNIWKIETTNVLFEASSIVDFFGLCVSFWWIPITNGLQCDKNYHHCVIPRYFSLCYYSYFSFCITVFSSISSAISISYVNMYFSVSFPVLFQKKKYTYKNTKYKENNNPNQLTHWNNTTI